MSDPVGPAPATGLLEGLTEGFGGGYSFREGIKSRRRAQQLQADLLTLRQQESARQQAAANREQTVFDEQQTAYHKAEALRAEVAAHLSSPTTFKTFGDYVSGRPATHTGAPLSPDARVAQTVGRTLGEFGGRELSPDQQLLVGTGEVPYGAIAPKAYHPRTRAEWLENLRVASGLRGQGTKLPITLDHAFTVLDRIYTQQDEHTGAWRSLLPPGERLRIAKKMVAGSVQPADFPNIKEPTAAAAPTAAPEGGGIMDRVRRFFGGGGPRPTNDVDPGMRAPAVGRRPGVPDAGYGSQPAAGPPEPGDGGDQRLEQARLLISQYRDLPQEDLEGALRDQGYDEETIRAILGSGSP